VGVLDVGRRDERLGGQGLALAGPLEERGERVERGYEEGRCAPPAARQVAPARGAALVQVARLLRPRVGLAERQTREVLIGDRNVEAVAERAQVVRGEFLLLVRDHLALTALAEAEALDGLRENHGRLSLVAHRGG